MSLHAIIDEIADQADDFLGGTTARNEARAGISELLNADYPQLTPAEKTEVTTGVMAILEEEGFFEGVAGGDGAGGDAAEDLDE